VEPAGVAATGPRLRRVLGVFELMAGGVGIIIGAGIYVLVGEAAQEAGAAVWLSFVLAGTLSALTALSYCELAAMFPAAAAEYEYTRQAMPERLAFLVGWVMNAGLAVAAGTVALGFGRYAGAFVDVAPRWPALALLVAVVLIALTGIGRSARVMLVLAIIQVGGLAAVIISGVDHVGDVSLTAGATVGGTLGGAALVFFAFIGFDEVATLAEETRNPGEDVPRALLGALGLSTLLYLAVAVVAVSVLGASDLAASERPLADVLGHALGSGADDAISAVALASTTNTTLLAITAGSRMTYGMAVRGAMPPVFAHVWGRTGVPLRALVALAAVAGAFALIGDISLIASVTDVAIYLVFLAVNATVVLLRRQRPVAPRPFRAPLAVGWVPVLPVLGLGATVLMMSQLDPRSWLLAAALVAAGAVLLAVRPGPR